MTVLNEGAPHLGYLSIEQLQEYSIANAISADEASSQRLATSFFNHTLRRGGAWDTFKDVYHSRELFVDSDGIRLELYTPDADSSSPMRNLDTVAQIITDKRKSMIEAAYEVEFERQQIYLGRKLSRVSRGPGSGEKALALVSSYVEERAKFLGVQLEQTELPGKP